MLKKNFFYLWAILICSLSALEQEQPKTATFFYKQCSSESNLPYIQIEYLYWKSQNRGFISGTAIQSTSNFSLATKPVKPKFHWDSGFRVALGWNIPYDFWSSFIEYTYFRTNTSTNTKTSESEAIAGYWTLTDELATSATTKWRLKEDLVDAAFSKSYLVGRSLLVSPFLGLRWGWIRQKFESNLFNSQPNLGFPSLFSASQNFHGGGPVIGILSNWSIGKYFGFLAKLSTSMLYGKASVNQLLEEVVNMNFNTTSRVLAYSETNQELLPNFQMQLGGSCGICFCKTMFLEFMISWEANYWFNQYLLSFIQPSSGIFDDIFNKPVTQQGITAQIRLDF